MQRKQHSNSEDRVFPFLTMEDFDTELFDSVRNRIRMNRPDHLWPNLSDHDILKSAGMWLRDSETGKEGYTLAAAMLFGNDRTIHMVAPFYKIDAICRQYNTDLYDDREFAVSSLRLWWVNMGKIRYPNADCLYVTADGGGSNGSRNKLWKSELQTFSNETGLKITVSHFPPGTSKWNKIEHRMFSQISKNWRGRPLETLQVIINLISSTTTKNGLKIKCGLDSREYKTGQKVSEKELASVNIVRDGICGSWNYTISPQ